MVKSDNIPLADIICEQVMRANLQGKHSVILPFPRQCGKTTALVKIARGNPYSVIIVPNAHTKTFVSQKYPDIANRIIVAYDYEKFTTDDATKNYTIYIDEWYRLEKELQSNFLEIGFALAVGTPPEYQPEWKESAESKAKLVLRYYDSGFRISPETHTLRWTNSHKDVQEGEIIAYVKFVCDDLAEKQAEPEPDSDPVIAWMCYDGCYDDESRYRFRLSEIEFNGFDHIFNNCGHISVLPGYEHLFVQEEKPEKIEHYKVDSLYDYIQSGDDVFYKNINPDRLIKTVNELIDVVNELRGAK